jgi:TonB family protein
MDCVERIQIPRYPPLAKQARIEGSITASVVLLSDGTVHDIETTVESRYGHAKDLFGSPVEKVIKAAKFRSGCSEKIVELVFHFDLSGASQNPGESFSFGYPNAFWIVAEAQTVQP